MNHDQFPNNIELNTDALETCLHVHVLSLGIAERHETDPTLKPFIAAQKRAQEGRLSVVRANLRGDTEASAAALEQVSEACGEMYDIAMGRNQHPLSDDLLEEHGLIVKRLGAYIEDLQATHTTWASMIAEGDQPTHADALDMLHRVAQADHDIAGMRYEFALKVVGLGGSIPYVTLH